jgi:Biotin-lipoyl like
MDKNRFEEESKLLLMSEQESSRPGKKAKGRWFLILLILSALGYGGYRLWRTSRLAAADATTARTTDNAGGRGRGGRNGRGAGGRAAVITIPARKVDMPVYLRGLGNAVASNTVTVRSRVDGQLVHVAFKEGDFVKQGDLLAEIDKRPFEVQLAQAKGQLARDQALLLSAKTEQQRNQLLLDKGLIPKQQFDTQAGAVGQYEGAIQADQAQIDNANLQITYSRIIAPIVAKSGCGLLMKETSFAPLILTAWSSSRNSSRFRCSSRFRKTISAMSCESSTPDKSFESKPGTTTTRRKSQRAFSSPRITKSIQRQEHPN